MSDSVNHAAILAGGKSTRMGRNKAALSYESSTLVHQMYLNATEVIADVRVIAEPDDSSLIPRDRYIPDHIADFGPLGGIYTALSELKNTTLILPCDTPFIRSVHIRHLVEHHTDTVDATVAVSRDGLEPLFAIYRAHLIPTIERNIAKKKYAVYRLLKELKVNFVDFSQLPYPENLFFNINTLSDYKKVLNLDSDEQIKARNKKI